MHSITFVLIYGTIWRSWTWGSSPTWGVWSLNVIKDKTNPHTHTYTQTQTHIHNYIITHTQIHNHAHTGILTRLCNEQQKNPGGHHGWVLVWWGSSAQLPICAIWYHRHLPKVCLFSFSSMGHAWDLFCTPREWKFPQNTKCVYDGSHR